MSRLSGLSRFLMLPALLVAPSWLAGCAQEQNDPVANAPRDNSPAPKAAPAKGASGGAPKGPGDNGAGIYSQPDYPGYAERHGSDKSSGGPASKSDEAKKKPDTTSDVKPADPKKEADGNSAVKPAEAQKQVLPELTPPK